MTFTFRNAGTQTANFTLTCTTDAQGSCKVTVPARAAAVAFDVTASALCQSTPVASTPGPINWVAAGPDSITLTIAKPTVNVGQTNEVSAALQCSGSMQAGSTVGAALKHLLSGDGMPTRGSGPTTVVTSSSACLAHHFKSSLKQYFPAVTKPASLVPTKRLLLLRN
jgi:hypothetical protein